MAGDDSKVDRPHGRDEMNLAEFPIALLAERASETDKTITFESQGGKLTISGSNDVGLPTAPDVDVIVALVSLTRQRNDFTNVTVPVSRYELLKILGWPNEGRSYRRLDESLRRWVGVTLRYEKSWWDNSIKCRVDASFHILESWISFDHEVRKQLGARQQTLPLSSFTWNKVFFQSCQDGNLKQLDLATYFALRSAISKRLYRFLDKRFNRGLNPNWTFDLRELAYEHVGLSRNYTPAKIKEKLKPALNELESIGFLVPMTPAERYTSERRGEWKIKLFHRPNPLAIPETSPTEPSGLEQELIARGVTTTTARELVRDFPGDVVRAQIEQTDWVREKQPKKIADVGAFLARAIRDNFAVPAGFESKANRTKREAAFEEQQRQEAKAKDQEAKAKAKEREVERKIRDYWERLTPEEQARVETEAIDRAEPEVRANCLTAPVVLRKAMMRFAREAHVRRLLGLPEVG